MTLLHAHAQYICIVNAKYQKPSVKALVQADFPVYAKAKSLFQSKQEKMAHFTKLLFCLIRNFWHQTSSYKCSMSLYCVVGLQRYTHLTIRYVSRYLLHDNDTYRDTPVRLEIISNCMRIIQWCSPNFKVYLKWFSHIFNIHVHAGLQKTDFLPVQTDF